MADPDSSTKRCGRCGEIKPLDMFHKDASKRDGVTSACKQCARKRAKDWYRGNTERSKASHDAYYQANKERMLSETARWRLENPERNRTMQAEWRLRNQERKRLNDIRWQSANRERQRLYRRVSESRRRAAVLASEDQHTAADVQELLRLQKFRCACCRTSLRSGFHVDHREPLRRGGSNGKANIQLLCPTCNVRKNAKDPIEFMQQNGFLI